MKPKRGGEDLVNQEETFHPCGFRRQTRQMASAMTAMIASRFFQIWSEYARAPRDVRLPNSAEHE